MLSLIILPLIAVFFISIITSQAGCILIWKRISFFSDSLAHSLLLGVALSLIMHINLQLSLVLTGIIFSVLIIFIKQKSNFNWDLILNIISPFLLAIALILSSIYGIQNELMNYLFGDLLLVEVIDLYTLIILALMISGWTYFRWHQLLMIIINQDIAKSLKINVELIRTEYLLLISITVGMLIKIVGILMITANMIIIPSATRLFCKQPLTMILSSIILNIISFYLAFIISFKLNLIFSPTLVIINIIIFVILILYFYIKPLAIIKK